MWMDTHNLAKAHRDKQGTRWHFRVWHEVVNRRDVVRVFFWNDERDHCGVVWVPPGGRTDLSALHGLIQRLVADPELRAKHQRELRFPLDRHYSEYGAFPEESGAPERR